LSCDSQAHYFTTSPHYPVVPKAAYQAPDASIDDLLKMHRTLGIDRGVLVHPIPYGTDNSLLIQVLKQAGPNYRGIAVINDSVSDKELQRMHDVGVRGIRFSFLQILGIRPDLDLFYRTLERIAPMGWCVKVHFGADEIFELEPIFRRVRIPAVIDHIGQTNVGRGLEQPAFRLLLDLMQQPNWWLMLSNGDRNSATGYPWDDTIPFAQALQDIAPDRLVWGTDWPHVRYFQKMPNDADLLELAYRYMPDPTAQQRILVDNPARLFGFV
jgi:predicted TIM-barrel fold metal-dependent hydrolase